MTLSQINQMIDQANDLINEQETDAALAMLEEADVALLAFEIEAHNAEARA